jgi:hypothetical protein
MNHMRPWLVVIGILASASARADHQHGMITGAGTGTTVSAGLSLVAAAFETMTYGGDYQGVIPAMRASHGRFAIAGSIGMYRLHENGRELFGAGDAVVHGQARLFSRGRAAAGVALAVSAPTGDHLVGFGMGHPMLMPATYAQWSNGEVSVDGSVGYGRAIGGTQSHESHGMWPLVEPMNLAEVTWTASGDITLARGLRTGARFSGAVPTGDGDTRVIGGFRVLWNEGRVDTAFEIQAGVAGDPFSLRGVLETALRF